MDEAVCEVLHPNKIFTSRAFPHVEIGFRAALVPVLRTVESDPVMRV